VLANTTNYRHWQSIGRVNNVKSCLKAYRNHGESRSQFLGDPHSTDRQFGHRVVSNILSRRQQREQPAVGLVYRCLPALST